MDKAAAVVYGNMGGVYIAKGLLDSAILLLTRSYDINIRPHYDNRDGLLTHIKLADAFLKKNDMPSLKEALANIKGELDTINHPLDADSKWHELMYHYYEKTDDQAAAFGHYREYTTLKDSLWKAGSVQSQADLDAALKDQQQINEIIALQARSKLHILYLSAVAVMLLMATAILVLIYSIYKRSRKTLHDLRVLKTALEKKNQEKDRILDIVAHDLRSPVGGIYALADLMASGMDQKDRDDSVVMIKNASQSALALIGDLLGYRNDAKEVLQKKPADIVKITDETIDLQQLTANEKNITLRGHFDAPEIIVSIDKEKIGRVLANLVGNAIKFSHQNAAVDVTVTRQSSSVLIAVEDSGIGIPAPLQEKVFELFTKSRRNGTAGETSYGLGLSITRQIVDNHGGKVWFESREGHGTTFYVKLPIG